MNFLLIVSGFLLLYASTFIEIDHTHWSKLLSIPGILTVAAGFNWHFVQGFLQ